MKRVFLAGEGRDELGGWFDPTPYRDTRKPPGVLVALLRKVDPDGWEIGGAVPWRLIRKYQVGGHRAAEARNVLGAAQKAKEAGCSVLAFTRDRDRSAQRQWDIEGGCVEAEKDSDLAILGGVAIENLDAWILALNGELRTEDLSDPKWKLAEKGIRSSAEKIDAVERAELNQVPRDAESLHSWLGRARKCLAP